MAPTKRVGPAFSPPRPKKSANTATSKSLSKTSTAIKPKSQKSTLGRPGIKKSKTTSKQQAKNTEHARRRSKLVSPTPSASDSLGGDSEDGSVPDDRSEDQDEGDEEEGNDTVLTNQDAEGSPEPDFILAEVTHDSSSNGPPLPLGLIHRILHSNFSEPEKTKISTDAREVVGKYIEVFVREAIMRCAYEKNGESNDGGGWLELEDLEKVAVQLCLDF